MCGYLSGSGTLMSLSFTFRYCRGRGGEGKGGGRGGERGRREREGGGGGGGGREGGRERGVRVGRKEGGREERGRTQDSRQAQITGVTTCMSHTGNSTPLYFLQRKLCVYFPKLYIQFHPQRQQSMGDVVVWPMFGRRTSPPLPKFWTSL